MSEIDEPAATFKELEHRGWSAKAATYDAHAGRVTAQAVERMLEAGCVTRGSRVLDIACGPGYVAGGAAARGARVVGVDFAASMVAQARRNFPGIEFREGDAEALDFPAGSFDAVLCPFGMLHLADPDRAIDEARRVLRPGGHYVFTVWSAPERHRFFDVVLRAIRAHGTIELPLPPAPPIFRFADAVECTNTLVGAGFAEVTVTEIMLVWTFDRPERMLEMVREGTVRTAMLLALQSSAARAKIEETILARAAEFKSAAGYEVAWPAVMTSALRP